MPKRYMFVLAGGIVVFIAVGIATFYGAEVVNAPMGDFVDHENPLENR